MDRNAADKMQARLRKLGARVEALNLILGEVAASTPDIDLAALRGDLADRMKPFGMVGDAPMIAIEAIETAEATVHETADRLAGLLENGALIPRAGLPTAMLGVMLAMVRDDCD